MSQRIFYVCGALLIAGLLCTEGWLYRDRQPPGEAWIIDRPERIVSGISPGQPVKVTFNMKNTSGRSLRLLGSSAC